MVEPGQGLDEDVCTFIGELVASGRKQVQRLVKVEIIVTETTRSPGLMARRRYLRFAKN